MQINEDQKKMELNEDQEKIITYDGAQIVVAGAGTGKTETLTRHIMYLLLEKKYALHEVVAMTFTEKAAAEMRERVYKAISKKVLSPADENEKQYVERLRRNFPAQNRITTIDGFNAGLLSTFPEYSPLPADYQIVDDYSDFILETETKRAFLRAVEKDELLLEQFLAFHEQMEQNQLFEKIVELAKEDADELRGLQQDISREVFESELLKLIPIHAGALWEEYVESIPEDLPTVIDQIVRDEGNVIFALKETGEFRKKWRDNNTEFIDIIDNWPKETAKRFDTWRKYLKKYLPIFDPEKAKPDMFKDDWLCHQALQKLAAMAMLYQQVEQQLIRQQGRVRFGDVANAALEMLEKHSSLVQEIRKGIRHILVDEFQDTSLVQWKLIQLLRGPDNVMLVGDPKQSIYRFRGADVTVFDKVRATEFSADQQRELTYSQRSCPALVRFYNDLFSEVLSTEEDRPAYEAAHQNLKIAKHQQEKSDAKQFKGGVTWIESTFAEKDIKMENTAETLAIFLRSLQEDAGNLSQGREVLLPQYTDITQKLANNKPGVIGVLFATHDGKKTAEKLLRDHGVHFSSYHGRGFYDSMPVLLAINLARFFYDAQDNLALSGILRSPLCGVSDMLLAKLALQHQDLWEALNEGATNQILFPADHHLLTKVETMLADWREASRVLPFSDVLEKVWNDSWLPFYFKLENDSGQQEENFNKLVDILRGAQRSSEYGMAEIIAFLQTLREKKAREAQAELPDGGSVQLMTLHASKGLGFDMTILAQMNLKAMANKRKVRSGELGNPPQKYFSIKSLGHEDSRKETTLWSLLRSDDAAREKAELKRKLYVSCTRAMEHLVLLEPAESEPESWGRWIEPVRHTHVLQRFTYEQLQQMKLRWLEKVDEDKPREISQVQNSLDGARMPAEISVSQLLDHLFPNAEKDIELAEDRELPELPVRAKERGSLIHRLLEWDGKSTYTAIGNLMRLNHLPASDAEAMEELVQNVRAELVLLPFNHEMAKQEFVFILPAAALRESLDGLGIDKTLKDWLAGNNNWCNGIIDYLAPLESGGYAILDFKTHWNSAAQHSDSTRERIKMQLQLYAIAARQLGFDVKKLYALRIYGSSGEIKREEYDFVE